jgi:hypothetical protein
MTKKPKLKKRGRKPGVKVGPYKKRKTGFSTVTGVDFASIPIKDWRELNVGQTNTLALCGQLEDTIDTLAARLTSINSRINSLM